MICKMSSYASLSNFTANWVSGSEVTNQRSLNILFYILVISICTIRELSENSETVKKTVFKKNSKLCS